MKQILLSVLFFLVILNVFTQIPPGYYDNASGLSGNALKSALHNIIKNHIEYSYSQTDEILMETDEDPANSNNVILVYTGRSQAKSTFGGNPNDWNREHVWAKSHGGFGDNPPCGTDLHHMKPSDASVNSDRGNKDFDNGGVQHPEATGCYYTQYTWEPRDEVKGDIARMIFYMAVRYEGDNGEPDLEVVDWVNTSPQPKFGKFSTLLQWNEFDPPDAFEINRNNVIYSYQNNRNPFIDHPEYINAIWDPAAIQEEWSKLVTITLYPIPADDWFSFNLNSSRFSSGIMEVLNSQGVKMMTHYIYDNSCSNRINTSSMTDGLYLVIFNLDDQITSQKLIIRH